MRRTLLPIALLCICFMAVQAQTVNRGFAFQGYARNLDGSAVSDQTIQVRFTISPNGGSAAFTETQTVDTDAFGIFVADIGTENETDFEALQFESFDYFLKVEVALTGGSFVEISNKQLKSVPYAQSAVTAVSATSATKADNGVPSGTILPFAGPATNIPDGYVVCDGTGYDQNDDKYKDLFDAIGTSWGEDGTKFRVPDLRGYFLRGVSSGSGNDPDAASRIAKNGSNSGDKVGSYQDDELEAHSHTGSGNTDTDGAHKHTSQPRFLADNDGNDDTGFYVGASGGSDPQSQSGTHDITDSGSAHSHAFSFTTDASGGLETRPKNAYVLYIIKL